jgi:MPBQ/MSBQ methyltransferase
MASLSYFEGILDAWADGLVCRSVHLGFWDNTKRMPGYLDQKEFEKAQAALTRHLLGGFTFQRNIDIVDVGCGLGGPFEYLNDVVSSSVISGVNIDARQLNVCASIRPKNNNNLSLFHADACRMPLPGCSQDVVICIEAMFHFSSRSSFFREAHRVLKPKGKLILTDILISPGFETQDNEKCLLSHQYISSILNEDYGPWPHPFLGVPELCAQAAAAGFDLVYEEDITCNTLPSYSFISPKAFGLNPDQLTQAGELLAWLHYHDRVVYYHACFQKS